MAFVDHIGSIASDLPRRGRVRFIVRNSGGTEQTGGTLDIWLLKNDGAAVTQIVTAGAPAGGRTLTEVDAANLPGLWELQLLAADLDSSGVITLRVEHSGTGEPLYLMGDVHPSQGGIF